MAFVSQYISTVHSSTNTETEEGRWKGTPVCLRGSHSHQSTGPHPYEVVNTFQQLGRQTWVRREFLNAGQWKIGGIKHSHLSYSLRIHVVFIFKCPESTITNVRCQCVGSFPETKQDDYDLEWIPLGSVCALNRITKGSEWEKKKIIHAWFKWFIKKTIDAELIKYLFNAVV